MCQYVQIYMLELAAGKDESWRKLMTESTYRKLRVHTACTFEDSIA